MYLLLGSWYIIAFLLVHIMTLLWSIPASNANMRSCLQVWWHTPGATHWSITYTDRSNTLFDYVLMTSYIVSVSVVCVLTISRYWTLMSLLDTTQFTLAHRSVQGAAKTRMLSGALVIVCSCFIAVKSHCDIVQTAGNDCRVVSERSFHLIWKYFQQLQCLSYMHPCVFYSLAVLVFIEC